MTQRRLLPILLFISVNLVVLTGRATNEDQFATGVWSTRAPMPVLSSEFASATIGGKIYSAGGFNPENQKNLLIYDPPINQWKRGRDLPEGNHHSGVVAVADKLYVIGGSHSTSAFHIYDPASSNWSTGAPIPTPRGAMATAVVNNKIHLIGGSSNISMGIALNDHEVYDPATNTWERKAVLPTPSEHVVAGVLGGRIYVVGGRSRFSNMNTTQIYNVQTNTWSQGPALNFARSGMGVAVFENRLYVFGGEDLRGQQVIDSSERFDPFTGRWEVITEMPVALHGNAAAVAGKYIYVFGGSIAAGSGQGTNTSLRLSISEAPAAPTDLRAKALSASSIELLWQDRSDNESRFVVQRKSGTSFRQVAMVTANVRRHVISGLAPATEYTFRVFAANRYASSTFSNTVTQTTKN